MFWSPFLRFYLGPLNSNIHPWLRVVHVGVLMILMADITPGKRSRIVTFSEQ